MAERERKRSMTAYDLIKRYPEVFVTTPDENGNEVFGINANASLKDPVSYTHLTLPTKA